MIFKKNKMKQRIEKLYQKMEFIHNWIGRYDCVDTHLKFSICYNVEQYYMFRINTKYGVRGIIVGENKSLRYCEYEHRTITIDLLKWGAEYLWDYNYFDIFKIKFNNNEMELDPSPMLKLSAKEIDLAILEFEIEIDKLYKQSLENKNKHNNCIKILSQ